MCEYLCFMREGGRGGWRDGRGKGDGWKEGWYGGREEQLLRERSLINLLKFCSGDYGDGRGNVDADSIDEGQPEAFDPDYDSVPTRNERPNQPPPYKDTPGYQHGGNEIVIVQ